MKGGRGETSWVRVARPRRRCRLRLVCLPYAGAGAWLFRDWADELPDDVEVCGVELPGRGARLREAPLRRLRSMVEGVLPRLEPLMDVPLVLFGHSLGGLLAFELARALEERRVGQPLQLLVSATCAPQLHRVRRPIHGLARDAFVAELRRMNGTPSEVLADEQLLERVLPYVRADLEAFETYRFEPGARLSCPIVAFGGTHDRSVRINALEAWDEVTRSRATVHLLPGDHFFLIRPYSGFAETLRRALESPLLEARSRAVRGAPGSSIDANREEVLEA